MFVMGILNKEVEMDNPAVKQVEEMFVAESMAVIEELESKIAPQSQSEWSQVL